MAASARHLGNLVIQAEVGRASEWRMAKEKCPKAHVTHFPGNHSHCWRGLWRRFAFLSQRRNAATLHPGLGVHGQGGAALLCTHHIPEGLPLLPLPGSCSSWETVASALSRMEQEEEEETESRWKSFLPGIGYAAGRGGEPLNVSGCSKGLDSFKG